MLRTCASITLGGVLSGERDADNGWTGLYLGYDDGLANA
jgi:hypothetical protein